MTIEEIEEIVLRALPMRSPKFSDAAFPAISKVRALEDYLLESSHMQGELEEALFWLDALVEQLKTQIEQMTGYEVALPNKRQERITKEDVLTAKRVTDPIVFDAGFKAKHLRATALRQIERLRWEAGQGPVSRAYTLISGG